MLAEICNTRHNQEGAYFVSDGTFDGIFGIGLQLFEVRLNLTSFGKECERKENGDACKEKLHDGRSRR